MRRRSHTGPTRRRPQTVAAAPDAASTAPVLGSGLTVRGLLKRGGRPHMPLAAPRRARRAAAAFIPAAALLATALSSAAPADAAATTSSIAVDHPSWATPSAD